MFELERNIQPSLDNKKTNLKIYLEEPILDLMSFRTQRFYVIWKTKEYIDLVISFLHIWFAQHSNHYGGNKIYHWRVGDEFLQKPPHSKNVQELFRTWNWVRIFAEFECKIIMFDIVCSYFIYKLLSIYRLSGDVEDCFYEDKDTITSSSRIWVYDLWFWKV